jgi:hypothetical protein
MLDLLGGDRGPHHDPDGLFFVSYPERSVG